MDRNPKPISVAVVLFAAAILASACAPRPATRGDTVGALWRRQGGPEYLRTTPDRGDRTSDSERATPDPGRREPDAWRAAVAAHREAVDVDPSGSASGDGAIATVDGVAIGRATVWDLLIRSRGVGVVEQLVALETARACAAGRGLSISADDVERERSLAYRRVADPLSAVTSGELDRDAAGRLLASILSERNISREEFDIILQRNAYLRKIVQSEESFTEVELRDEYDRACGERVRVRHIQLATAREVARVQERLDAGVPFAHLARENNANEFSAAADGLLEPFARSEDRIPIALRDAAFSLSPGEVSPPIREGAWFHLIRLEERVAVESVDFDQIKEALIERLRARNSDQRMYERYEQLFRAAAVAIHDPVLREAYFLAHPRAGASR